MTKHYAPRNPQNTTACQLYMELIRRQRENQTDSVVAIRAVKVFHAVHRDHDQNN
jgi:hypothetical protein